DLAWGAVLTRFLSIASNQLGRDYLSVGRVQSPSLALIVDREREIEDFVPQDYWTLHARFRRTWTAPRSNSTPTTSTVPTGRGARPRRRSIRRRRRARAWSGNTSRTSARSGRLLPSTRRCS